jgi:hypothetical protein
MPCTAAAMRLGRPWMLMSQAKPVAAAVMMVMAAVFWKL